MSPWRWQTGTLHVDILMKQFVSKKKRIILCIYLGGRAAAGMSCKAGV